jgi:hypothetical protein
MRNNRSRVSVNDCEQPCKPKRKTLGICLGGPHARPNWLSSFIHSAFVAWRLGGLLGSATGSGPREGSGGATFPPSPTQLTSATSWQSHRFWNFDGVIDYLINKAGKVEGKERLMIEEPSIGVLGPVSWGRARQGPAESCQETSLVNMERGLAWLLLVFWTRIPGADETVLQARWGI